MIRRVSFGCSWGAGAFLLLLNLAACSQRFTDDAVIVEPPAALTSILGPSASLTIRVRAEKARVIPIAFRATDAHVTLTDPQGRAAALRLEPDSSGAWNVELHGQQRGWWTIRFSTGAPASPCSIRVEASRESSSGDSLKWGEFWNASLLLDAVERNDGRAALRCAEQSMVASRSIGPKLRVADRAEQIGIDLLQSGIGDLREAAESFFREALSIREIELGDQDPAKVDAYNLVSTYYYLTGRYRESAELQETALSLAVSVHQNEPDILAYHRRDLGLIYYEIGRYSEAANLFEMALAFHRDQFPIDAAATADLLNNLGEARRLLGDFNTSANHFLGAERLLRESLSFEVTSESAAIESQRLLATVQNSLAGLLGDQGRFVEAEARLLEAIDLWESFGANQPEAVATAYLNLGENYRNQLRLAEAESWVRKAMERARQDLGDTHQRMAWFYKQRGMLNEDLGDLESADSSYALSIAALESKGLSGQALLARPLHDRAMLAMRLGQLDRAESLYRRAIEIRRDVHGPQSAETARSLAGLSACLLLRFGPAHQEARRVAEEAANVLASFPAFSSDRLLAQATVAEIERAAGHVREAEARLETVLQEVEASQNAVSLVELRRAEFLANQSEAYRRLTRWYLQDGRIEAAFQTMERFRARLTLRQLSGSNTSITSKDPRFGAFGQSRDSARAEYRRCERVLDSMLEGGVGSADPKNLRRAESARDSAYRAYLRAQSEVDRAFNGTKRSAEAEMIELDKVTALASARNETWLYYWVAPDCVTLITISPESDRPSVRRLEVTPSQGRVLGIPPGSLTATTLRQSLEGPRPDGLPGMLEQLRAHSLGAVDARALHALYECLVPSETREILNSSVGAVIVPDGSLLQFPFESLVVGMEQPLSPRYWLDDGPAIRYAPSASVLHRLERYSPVGSTSILTVSSPSTPSRATAMRLPQALIPIPGTALESSTIASAFGSRHVTVLEGPSATESNVLRELRKHSILHFASHAFVAESPAGVDAGLVLFGPDSSSAGGHDDGILGLDEIQESGVRANLVVLSACLSSAGPRVEGEGVYSLSRAFLLGGCPRVIGALWAVEDRSTSRLMRTFFESIARSGAHGVQCASELRDAKLSVRRSPGTEHPYFWASFVLAGLP